MNDKRLQLHEIFCEIMNMTAPDGDRHVYFQPPDSTKMKYPCIRYNRARVDPRRANNSLYAKFTNYEVMLIDKNPDSEYVEKLLSLPRCRHERTYKADNLNHDVFTIYI